MRLHHADRVEQHQRQERGDDVERRFRETAWLLLAVAPGDGGDQSTAGRPTSAEHMTTISGRTHRREGVW